MSSGRSKANIITIAPCPVQRSDRRPVLTVRVPDARCVPPPGLGVGAQETALTTSRSVPVAQVCRTQTRTSRPHQRELFFGRACPEFFARIALFLVAPVRVAHRYCSPWSDKVSQVSSAPASGIRGYPLKGPGTTVAGFESPFSSNLLHMSPLPRFWFVQIAQACSVV